RQDQTLSIKFKPDLELVIQNKAGIITTGTVLLLEAFDYLCSPLLNQLFNLVISELFSMHFPPDAEGAAFLPSAAAGSPWSFSDYSLSALRTSSESRLCFCRQ